MNLPRTTLGVLIALLFSESALAASMYEEQGQLIRAPRALGVLGENLFGDETNFYNGSLSFSQTDVSLPGNNALPMNVTRRFTAGDHITTVGHFGHWELDIPHMHGMFSAASGQDTSRGWIVPLYSWVKTKYDRCSSFGAPPDSAGAFGSLADFAAEEFWHGNHLSIPGSGSQEVVLRTGYDPQSGINSAGSNLNYPNDGYKYPLVTKNLWAIRCLPTLSGGGIGEGFLAVSPDGTQYQFDWMVSRPTKSLTKGSIGPQSLVQTIPPTKPATGGAGIAVTDTAGGASITSGGTVATIPPGDTQSSAVVVITVPTEDDPNVSENNILPRQEVWIMPTLVTDKFGNTVRYVWDTQDPWKLLQMLASDGRQLTFTYIAGTHLISSVSDATPTATRPRTWIYNYANVGSAQYPLYTLGEVINPDNSRWQLAGIDSLAASLSYGAGSPGCDDPGSPMDNILTGSMTHPSGAVGTFALRPVLHGRTGVVRDCREAGYAGSNFMEIGINPRYFHTNSLVQKNISGPGLPTMGWSVNYGPANAGWSDCVNCVATKTVTVTDPKGDRTRYTFGNRYNLNEGLLLQTDYGFDGSSALRSVTQTYRAITGGPYVNPVGRSEQNRGDAEMSARVMPVERRITSQQGVIFSWQANSFDTKARATSVTRSSSLGQSRTEQTVYQDIAGKWVLGLVASVTETGTGRVMQANTYHPDNGNLLTVSHFGHLDETRTYWPDGTLKTKADGLNHITNFANYKRGLAQNVSYADFTGESALVNDIGLITSTTDAAGFTTTYDYDDAGRLRRISYPAGDGVAWNDTTITTEQVGNDEYGIGPMHWKQTVATGSASSVSYLDAFWRPVLSRTYDTGAESQTSKMVLRQFDHKGKTTFESYPQRFISSVNSQPAGSSTQYDALSRPTLALADSEQGKLRTVIEYLAGFQKRVTNPRNKVTTSSFQVFDEPNESSLSKMLAPEGVNLEITRDVFGKPMAMTRSGNSGGYQVSNTRQYVYDNYQRLCKTIEPETGTMKQQFDDANNLMWRANGTTGTLLDACYLENVMAAEKVSYTYDAQNRLKSTTFGDNSPAITRTWTPDGLPETVSSNGLTWTTGYNRRRLPEQESLPVDGTTYTLGWRYDANGHLTRLTYPNNLVLDYAPNALGEATQVGKYASGISYHPNGATAGFTYGNGINRSLALNARNLPGQAQDSGVLNDLYSYDENGNVIGISDQQENISNRSMSYDDLDRLISANALKLWGMASYTYDALDNIRTSAVGSRNSTHNYDLTGSNRLLSISSNGGTTNYSYDVLGNITGRGAQGFVFDRGNRMSAATGKASYSYDGLGHRTRVIGTDGSRRLQLYSPAGQLLYATQNAIGGKPASTTNYIYLHHGLIAEVNQ
jgi:YD repeat-containing protein